jgi:outer membrane immunogenic protein
MSKSRFVLGPMLAGAIVAMPAAVSAAGPKPVLYEWTGFYAGAHAGYGWDGDDAAFFTPNDPYAVLFLNGGIGSGGQPVGPVSVNSNGALGGLQAGYSWQFDRTWVAGIETDFTWSDIDGSGSTTALLAQPSLTATFNVRQDVEWFGTLRGRLGYLASNDWLLYATGGLAFGRTRESLDVTTAGSFTVVRTGTGGFGANCYRPVGQCFSTSSSQTNLGWSAGVGTEIALGGNATFRVEYLFVDLGSGDPFAATVLRPNTVGLSTIPTSITAHTGDLNLSTVSAGINYRF